MNNQTNRVTVFAPATVANLGPGYDVLGLALEQPGDRVTARRTERPGVRLVRVSGDAGALPPADDNNTAAVAARLVLERLEAPFGVDLELHKGLPLGSGLGSSGASAAAAATAVNLLAGTPLLPEELIAPCARAEAAACGAAHPDNVAPALLGGITLARSAEEVTRIHTGLDLFVAVVSPPLELPTREARAAIPREVPIGDAIHNCANLASMVYALAVGDIELVGKAMVDHIAEPRRAGLIPGFAAAKQAALDAGALGASISGAGPTLFALCKDRDTAELAGQAMGRAMEQVGPVPTVRVSAVAEQGARAIPTEREA